MAVLLRGDFDRCGCLAKKAKAGPQPRRLLALAAIYDVLTRTEAPKIGGVGLQIILDWVIRFNASGPVGLLSDKTPERTPRLAHRFHPHLRRGPHPSRARARP